jgi:hypothetical protein
MDRCPRANQACPQYNNKLGCVLVRHHLFYPKRDYQTSLEKHFRELPENKVSMCMGQENEVHRVEPYGPPKPSTEIMLFCVNREQQRRELGI